MFGADDAVLGVGAGVVAGGLNYITQRDAANNANQASQAAVAEQERYQTQMSSTQYQRGVQDLKAAGLNPILAATHGMSDSAMSGGSFQGSMSQAQPGNAASTAVQAASESASLRSQQAQIDNLGAQSAASQASAAYQLAQAHKTALESGNVGRAGLLLDAQEAAARASSRLSNAGADERLPFARAGRYADQGLNMLPNDNWFSRQFRGLANGPWNPFGSRP